jgi:carboxymethylenebutenolidase
MFPAGDGQCEPPLLLIARLSRIDRGARGTLRAHRSGEPMKNSIELTAADGHRFAAYRAQPAAKARGAVLVVQEIFGVNSHIRSVADGYAADGYLALAPAFYDRAQRDFEVGYSQDDVQAGVKLMQQIDWNQTMADVAAAVAELQKTGKVGIVGYCWGGTAAWLAAARVAGISCSVPYYGGGMPDFADEKPKCPVMCHFGEEDQRPSLAQAKEIAAKHPSIQAYYYKAGHGFNCDQRASYNAEAAALAKRRTLEFFAKHLAQ